jgi:hypothetical protein
MPDTWAGVGLIVVGMAHQGYNSLAGYGGRDWRANFFPGAPLNAPRA